MHVHYSVTFTMRQLQVLRLMLRLQRIKVLRLGLQRYRAGTYGEAEALADILQKQDRIEQLDLALMVIESRQIGVAFLADLIAGNGGLAPVQFVCHEDTLLFAREVASGLYGAEAALGGQRAQAELLQAIQQEQEGLQLALRTATSENQDEHQEPINPFAFQAQPAGKQ